VKEKLAVVLRIFKTKHASVTGYA